MDAKFTLRSFIDELVNSSVHKLVSDSPSFNSSQNLFKTITPCPITTLPDKESLPISPVDPFQLTNSSDSD
ncbi:hypothetical protein llap_9277 [Limosa lapponica baueri]|uniref:Uncharacterized protein n=1 Tax=Limosa lapponica baueri TaxID=1758121 RepID=A0A2I0U318_LIMLA|nr:hypothetical protein llap_9277 [Limosa lapponica baueri]